MVVTLSCNPDVRGVVSEVRNTEERSYETLRSFLERELLQLLPPFRVSQPGEGFTARVGAFLLGDGGRTGLKADDPRQQTLTTASYKEDEMANQSLLHHYPSKSSIFSLPEREKEVC